MTTEKEARLVQRKLLAQKIFEPNVTHVGVGHDPYLGFHVLVYTTGPVDLPSPMDGVQLVIVDSYGRSVEAS